MILRGLAGVLIGIGYGVLAGVVITLLGRLEQDSPYPGPLIPDANEMRRLLLHLLIVITGVCGVLVGLVVGLSSVGKAKACAIGFGVGLLVLAFAGSLVNASWRDWLVLPIGLALLGVTVSVVTSKLRPHRRGAVQQLMQSERD